MSRTVEPAWPVRIAFLAVPLLAVALVGAVRNPPPPARHVLADFGGRPYDLTVAETEQQQARGLQGLSEPGPGEGMLFAFDPPREVTILIKSLPYPVDVAFVDAAGVVSRTVSIQPTPLGIQAAPSSGRVRYAVEVRRGSLAAGAIAPGSRFTIRRERP